jgi:hypothetical protein
VNARVPVVHPGWPTGQPAPARGHHALPAYGYPAAAPERVAGTRKLSHGHVLSWLLGGLAGLVAILIVVSLVAKPAPPGNCQGLTCSVHPPIGPPVEVGQLYTNPEFKFTARVIDSSLLGVAPVESTAGGELTLTFSSGGSNLGELQLAGESDNGRTAEQIVESVVNQIANGAQLAYVIPGSMIGYQLGFGAAYNFDSDSGDGQSATDRIIVMASIKQGLAIVAVAAGPLVRFGDGHGQVSDGHPSIADLAVALGADPIVDSVLWPGQSSP